jgi:OmpA-OmpF porin, OOP family
MKLRAMTVIGIAAVFGLVNGCATKKYVRNRVDERLTPLEARASELEETSRRNSQELARISRDIEDVRGRADRAQQSADRAASSAEQANTRVTTVEQSIGELRSNLDKYTVQKTITIRFQQNSCELDPEETAKLDEMASQIVGRNGFLLEIEGYASADGDPVKNEQLSEARSDTVRRYFAEKHYIPLFRMSLVGMGTIRPVAPNDSPEGRAQNRRVEVRLLTNNAVSQQTR